MKKKQFCFAVSVFAAPAAALAALAWTFHLIDVFGLSQQISPEFAARANRKEIEESDDAVASLSSYAKPEWTVIICLLKPALSKEA